MEEINFTANLQNPKGQQTSSTRADDYFVRVYEKSASGELFDINAQGAALPVELGDFTAKALVKGNELTWTTYSEVNTDFVEVSISPNGSTDWQVIGRVDLQGNSTSTVEYSFFDEKPYSVSYYKLNFIDLDGKSEFSPIVNVVRDEKAGNVIISPNPARNQFTLSYTASGNSSSEVSIVNMTGEIIYRNTKNTQEGMNILNVETTDFASGIYFISILIDGNQVVEKLVIE